MAERIEVIDISYAQQKVDFKRVKASGVQAVIIRTGYYNKTDTMFDKHMKGAIDAGLDIGVYTYIMSDNPAQAALEAQQTVERLKKYKGHITYPVFCDMESSKYYESRFTKRIRTDMITAFCNTIAQSGYYPAIYINPSWLEQYTYKNELMNKYDIWLAAWTDNPNKPTKYNYNQKMWQWGKGALPGVVGEVDGNLCYVDYPSIIRKSGKNFLPKKAYTLIATKQCDLAECSRLKAELGARGFTITTKEM